ncbi:hypothetical protein BDV18DRAFT_147602 [Aspergillus unguis]
MPPQMPQMPSMQPGPSPGPNPVPFRSAPQNVAREPPHQEQANWSREASRGQPPQPSQPPRPPQHAPPPPPVVHNNMNRPPIHDARVDAQDQAPLKPAIVPDRKNLDKEVRHHGASRTPQVKIKAKRDRSPKQRLGSEPELVPDDSSSGDEILTPDYDDDSDAEFSSRGTKLKTPQPWRGSLYHHDSSIRSRNRYRTHHRKEPRYPKDPLQLGDHGYKRHRDDGVIDIYPGDGRYARHSSRSHGISRQLDIQPRIVQQQPSSDDLIFMNHPEVLMNQARGRAHNDIRSRMLRDWQQDLEQREYAFEYKQMLRSDPGRMDDSGYPSRSRSLREPFAYHQGYLPRALHYH